MIRRAFNIAFVAVFLFTGDVMASVAAAKPAGEATPDPNDPTRVATNSTDIALPILKAVWVIAVIWKLISVGANKQASKVGGSGIALVAAGLFLWNPGGAGDWMSNIASRVF